MLLDSEFHCQITDFGSTRHSEVTVTRSTTALLFNYAAPELFGMCTTCRQFDCNGSHDGQDEQHRTKTMETDVYAFGCLYYAVRFRLSLSNLIGTLSDILYRYTLILFLFMGRRTSASYNSSQREHARTG